MTSLLAAVDVSKTFAGYRAVDNVSLAVPRGEVRGLVGPNGAGKSTLLHVLAGRYPPSSGRVLLEERDVTALAPRERVRLGLGIGIVAEMAVREDPHLAPGGELVWRPASHLFGQNVARVAFKRGTYLRNFVYTFAELVSDRLSRALITRAMSGDAETYDL